MSDHEAARSLEKAILGGEPFYYPCGCFGVIVEVNRHNADWVCIRRISSCGWLRRMCLCGGYATREPHPRCHHITPDGCMLRWRKRDGGFISQDEWDAHIEMSEYVYGRKGPDSSSPR